MPVLELLSPQPGERILDLGCDEVVLTRKLEEPWVRGDRNRFKLRYGRRSPIAGAKCADTGRAHDVLQQ